MSKTPVILCDAHNHLQDERLQPFSDQIWEAIAAEPIEFMVVNGSCEEDWPVVLELGRARPQVIPSFGYHPWYVKNRSVQWQDTLRRFLTEVPSAVGEIGLDRWIEGANPVEQEEAFTWQMRLAAERNLPASIHCLKAWGRLYELLRAGPRPETGFLLHSFGGPVEMVDSLAKLGAYFSFPGYFAHERKLRQRETFKRVPLERLLVETDAPDQLLPGERVLYALPGAKGSKDLNHPANLRAIYNYLEEYLEIPLDKLAERVRENFLRLFAPVLSRKQCQEG